jgi:hypothetical protein
MVQGLIRLSWVLEFESGIEHHPVEVGISQGVGDVGGSQRGEVAYRVCRLGNSLEAARQLLETFLAEGSPQPVHAAEVGVHRHR